MMSHSAIDHHGETSRITFTWGQDAENIAHEGSFLCRACFAQPFLFSDIWISWLHHRDSSLLCVFFIIAEKCSRWRDILHCRPEDEYKSRRDGPSSLSTCNPSKLLRSNWKFASSSTIKSKYQPSTVKQLYCHTTIMILKGSQYSFLLLPILAIIKCGTAGFVCNPGDIGTHFLDQDFHIMI